MRYRPEIILVVFLLIFTSRALCYENQDRYEVHQKNTLLTALFASVDDAFLTLLDEKSELQWEASSYIKEHPTGAVAKLKGLIETKDSSWYLAMSTLTDIGGDSVVRFYCDLLDKNRYEMDESGKRKVYPPGSACVIITPQDFFGETIVKHLGRLGDKAADSCLQRAWLDSDDDVRASVPKARYDVGALTLEDLKKLAITDVTHRDIYFEALLAIGNDNIYTHLDAAIEIFRVLCAMPEAGNNIHSSAHLSLVHCYELKKDYDRALEHCDWVIKNSEVKEFPPRSKVRRPVLLFLQGKLTLNDLFELAKKEDGLYDEIEELGRFKDTTILDRIIKEASPNSEHVMETHYWKLEYFDFFDMPERAKSEFEFIIQNCKYDYVLNWAHSAMAKRQEIADRIARNKAR